MTIKKVQHFSNEYCSASKHASHHILTTTKFAIQNGINQSCRMNTFWFMDDYVTKFEKRWCMVFALDDLLSEDT